MGGGANARNPVPTPRREAGFVPRRRGQARPRSAPGPDAERPRSRVAFRETARSISRQRLQAYMRVRRQQVSSLWTFMPMKKSMSSSASPQLVPPAGWYPDPQGSGLRWWDGESWTQHFQPNPGAGSAGPPTQTERDIYQAMLRVVLVLGIAGLLIYGAIKIADRVEHSSDRLEELQSPVTNERGPAESLEEALRERSGYGE